MIKANSVIKCGLLLLCILAIISLLIAWNRYTICISPESRAQIKAIEATLETYKSDFGTYPQMDGANIVRALSGSNPAKKVYYEFRPNQINQAGYLLDTWGTPYQFGISQYSPTIVSAGKNKKFGDEDDESNTRE